MDKYAFKSPAAEIDVQRILAEAGPGTAAIVIRVPDDTPPWWRHPSGIGRKNWVIAIREEAFDSLADLGVRTISTRGMPQRAGWVFVASVAGDPREMVAGWLRLLRAEQAKPRHVTVWRY